MVHPAGDWRGCAIQHILGRSKLDDLGAHFVRHSRQCCCYKYSSESKPHHFYALSSCGRRGFANHDTVSRHMTQPKSGCSSWFDDLVRIRQDLLVRNGDCGGLDDLQVMTINDQPGTGDECDPLVDGDDQMSLDRDPQSSSIEYFLGAAQTYRGGSAFINKFHADEFSNHRASNIYYPFASAGDWELGLWLLRSGLSMNAINSFLSLDLVCCFYLASSAMSCSQYHVKIKSLPLSFRMAKELRGRAELLPSGPRWKSQEIRTSHPTKRPVLLYWRDSLELMEALFNNPEFQDMMDFSPY